MITAQQIEQAIENANWKTERFTSERTGSQWIGIMMSDFVWTWFESSYDGTKFYCKHRYSQRTGKKSAGFRTVRFPAEEKIERIAAGAKR